MTTASSRAAAAALERDLVALMAHPQWDPRNLPRGTKVHLGLRAHDGSWYRLEPSTAEAGLWLARMGPTRRECLEDSAALARRAVQHGGGAGAALKCVYTTRFPPEMAPELRCVFVGELVARQAGTSPQSTVAVALDDRRTLSVLLSDHHAVFVDRTTGRTLATAPRHDGRQVAAALRAAARRAGSGAGAALAYVICAAATPYNSGPHRLAREASNNAALAGALLQPRGVRASL